MFGGGRSHLARRAVTRRSGKDPGASVADQDSEFVRLLGRRVDDLQVVPDPTPPMMRPSMFHSSRTAKNSSLCHTSNRCLRTTRDPGTRIHEQLRPAGAGHTELAVELPAPLPSRQLVELEHVLRIDDPHARARGLRSGSAPGATVGFPPRDLLSRPGPLGQMI